MNDVILLTVTAAVPVVEPDRKELAREFARLSTVRVGSGWLKLSSADAAEIERRRQKLERRAA